MRIKSFQFITAFHAVSNQEAYKYENSLKFYFSNTCCKNEHYFSGMKIKLDDGIIYENNQLIPADREIGEELSDTKIGRKLEIIGVEGQYLGFKDSF